MNQNYKKFNDENDDSFNELDYPPINNEKPFDSNNKGVIKKNKVISKKGKFMLYFILTSTLLMLINMIIPFSQWFEELKWQAILNHDEQIKATLNTLTKLGVIVNWLLVLAITILCIIFLVKDKKKKNSVYFCSTCVAAGLLHIFVGTIGLTPMIYAISVLTIAIKNKKSCEMNGLSPINDTILIIIAASILLFNMIIIVT